MQTMPKDAQRENGKGKCLEASQRKSLQGLDNTAADGSVAFKTMDEICERLVQFDAEMKWSQSVTRRLQKTKQFLKTDYKVHYQESESPCEDNCKAFALSDREDKAFQVNCSHLHTMACENCENLKSKNSRKAPGKLPFFLRKK